MAQINYHFDKGVVSIFFSINYQARMHYDWTGMEKDLTTMLWTWRKHLRMVPKSWSKKVNTKKKKNYWIDQKKTMYRPVHFTLFFLNWQLPGLKKETYTQTVND